MSSGTVAIAKDEDVLLPATVQWLAKEGGLWITTPTQRPPLNWIPYHRYLDLLRAEAKSAEPRVYTRATQQADTEKQYLLLYPINDQARTVTWTGKIVAPRCVDDDDATDEIWKIPQPWRENVVYEWAVYYEMKDQANIQGRTEQLQLAQANLDLMVIEERSGRNAPHNLAPFGIGRRGRRAYL